MIAKYSGSAMMRAPVAAASSIRRPASCRLAATLGPEAIWIAATRNIDCVMTNVSRSASGVVEFLVMIIAGYASAAAAAAVGASGRRRREARDRGIIP